MMHPLSRPRVAASIRAPDTEAALSALHAVAPFVSCAEVRLDFMARIDLARLVRGAPRPLVLTCRPVREGGAFQGSERERLDILSRATSSGAAFVDVEWDALDDLRRLRPGPAATLLSRHFLEEMPRDLGTVAADLARRADAVKVVGLVREVSDVEPVVRLLAEGRSRVVAIGMGPLGAITRLIAPCFASCLFTYGSVSDEAATASGQWTVRRMSEDLGLSLVDEWTLVHVRVCTSEGAARAFVARNAARKANALHVPWLVPGSQVACASEIVRGWGPRFLLEPGEDQGVEPRSSS